MTPDEAAVIGACLLDGRVVRFAVQHVMPSDFSTYEGEEIFSAICWVNATAKGTVDTVTVAARLKEAGSRVDFMRVHKLAEFTPTASNVEYYAARVREASTRRSLVTIAATLGQTAQNEAVPPGDTLAATLEALRQARDDSPQASMALGYVSDLMATNDKYDWVIDGLIEKGDRFVLTGPPGGGKTTLARQMTIFAAAGIHPFFLTPIKPVKVMIIDRENSERQWRRASRALYEQAVALGQGRPQDIQIHCEPSPIDITRDADLGAIHRMIDNVEPEFVYIGPLYKLTPVAMQTDSEAAPVLAALDSIRERGCALLIEAHAGKGQELAPRGSSALQGWPEFGRGLRKSIDNPNEFFLEEWRGDRDARDIPSALYRGGPVPWLPMNTDPNLVSKFWNWKTPVQGSF